MGPYLYFLPASGVSHRDLRAATQLLRECYTVIRANFCPYTPGLIYETATAVSDLDKSVLGLVDWQ